MLFLALYPATKRMWLSLHTFCIEHLFSKSHFRLSKCSVHSGKWSLVPPVIQLNQFPLLLLNQKANLLLINCKSVCHPMLTTEASSRWCWEHWADTALGPCWTPWSCPNHLLIKSPRTHSTVLASLSHTWCTKCQSKWHKREWALPEQTVGNRTMVLAGAKLGQGFDILTQIWSVGS